MIILIHNFSTGEEAESVDGSKEEKRKVEAAILSSLLQGVRPCGLQMPSGGNPGKVRRKYYRSNEKVDILT